MFTKIINFFKRKPKQENKPTKKTSYNSGRIMSENNYSSNIHNSYSDIAAQHIIFNNMFHSSNDSTSDSSDSSSSSYIPHSWSSSDSYSSSDSSYSSDSSSCDSSSSSD